MRRAAALRHEFVDTVPKKLREGVLYVSLTYATAVHRCCCGCGGEVITPLSPIDWALTFDGETVSLEPSIGNWSFACQSHYWIARNRIIWARRWTRSEIASSRARDVRARAQREHDLTTGSRSQRIGPREKQVDRGE